MKILIISLTVCACFAQGVPTEDEVEKAKRNYDLAYENWSSIDVSIASLMKQNPANAAAQLKRAAQARAKVQDARNAYYGTLKSGYQKTLDDLGKVTDVRLIKGEVDRQMVSIARESRGLEEDLNRAGGVSDAYLRLKLQERKKQLEDLQLQLLREKAELEDISGSAEKINQARARIRGNLEQLTASLAEQEKAATTAKEAWDRHYTQLEQAVLTPPEPEPAKAAARETVVPAVAAPKAESPSTPVPVPVPAAQTPPVKAVPAGPFSGIAGEWAFEDLNPQPPQKSASGGFTFYPRALKATIAASGRGTYSEELELGEFAKKYPPVSIGFELTGGSGAEFIGTWPEGTIALTLLADGSMKVAWTRTRVKLGRNELKSGGGSGLRRR
jgi:hypothetical protein